MPHDVYIVSAIRTPIGRGRAEGALHSFHPVNLLALALDACVKAVGVDKADVEDVITGCVMPIGEQGADIGRVAALQAGFPIEVPGVQINRFCGSGQQAVHFAAQAIAAGDMDLVIASGVESMSRVPIGSDSNFSDEFKAQFPYPMVHQGWSAELMAVKYGLTRQEADAFAIESHARASAGAKSCFTSRELFPIEVTVNGETRKFAHDEGVRPAVDPAKMATLPTIFKPNGVVTAANASQISDGAAAVLLASGAACEKHGLKKRAKVIGRSVVGSDPEMMLDGPIEATRRALKKTGLALSDIDAFEINEAFATVPLAWAKTLGADLAKVNIQGGAIAHGHPLGATGAVLMTKLVNILERTGGRYGLQSMCEGFGMANATIIERVDA